MNSRIFYGCVCVMILLLFDCRCWSWSDGDCPSGFKFAPGTGNQGTKFSTNGVTEGWAARGNKGRWVLTPFTHFTRNEGKIKCGEAMSKVGDSGTKICCYSDSNTPNEFSSLSGWTAANPATMGYRYTYRRGNTQDGYTYTVLENSKNVVRCQAGSDEGGVFPERGFKSSLSCQRTNSEVIPSSLTSTSNTAVRWTTCGNGGGQCTNIVRSNQIQWFRYGNAGRWVYGAILIEPSVAAGKNWVYCGRQTLGGFNPNQDASNVCQIAEIVSVTPDPPSETLYDRLAREFAPIINLFPYDTNRPSSVEDFFDIVDLKSEDGSVITNTVTAQIMGQYAGVAYEDYYLDFKEDAPSGDNVYMTGNLADSNGYVNAPLYCHITELEDEYRITYALFYPFNGFQTFRVNYKTDAFGTSDHTRNFEWSKFARHVSDWENVHIFVSKDTEEILRVQASQHGAEELTYPSEIEVDGTRTVLYSAWNSHAFYYKQKTQTIEDLGYQWALSAFTEVNWLKIIDTTSNEEIDKYMLAEDYNSNGVKVDVIDGYNNLVLITDDNESEFPWLNFDGSWGPPEMDNSVIDNPPDIEGNIDSVLMYDILPLVPASTYEEYLSAGGARGPATRNWWPSATVTHNGCPEGYILGTDDNGAKFSPVPINEGWIARGANGRWILTPFTHFMQSTGKIACGESLSKPGDDVDKICCISHQNTANDYVPRYWVKTNKVESKTFFEYRRGSKEEGMTYTVVEGPVNKPQCNAGSDEGGVFPHRDFAVSNSMICEVTNNDKVPDDLLSVSSSQWVTCGTDAGGRCNDIPPSSTPRWFRYGSNGHWVYGKILIETRVAVDNNWLYCGRKTLGGYNPYQGGNNVCQYADDDSEPSAAITNLKWDQPDLMMDNNNNNSTDKNTNINAEISSNIVWIVVSASCLFCCVFGICIMYLYQKRQISEWVSNNKLSNNSVIELNKVQKYSTTATHDKDEEEEDDDNDEGDSINV